MVVGDLLDAPAHVLPGGMNVLVEVVDEDSRGTSVGGDRSYRFTPEREREHPCGVHPVPYVRLIHDDFPAEAVPFVDGAFPL